MNRSRDSENVITHSILCVKLEPFEEGEDCTQNIDPLQPDSYVHTQMELMQDFKTEIESDVSNQAMNELIQGDLLKNDPGYTGTKIEEINIKTEYIDNEASSDDLLNSYGIIEDDRTQNQLREYDSSRHTAHQCVEINKQTGEENATTYEPHSSDVNNEQPTNDTNLLNATSPVNPSGASADSSSKEVDVLSVHKHSNSEEKECKQSPSPIAHSLLHPSYVCDVCDMKFNNSRHLVKHKVVHMNQKPHICDVCKKGFSYPSVLVKHKRIHTGQKPYVCEICKNGFSFSHDLVRHKRTHTGQKPYICVICNKRFNRSSNLVTHERTHTGQNPYVCDICEKRFSVSSALVRHKRIHTGQKPYDCDICKKRFSESFSLVKHKRIHTGQKPYSCDICKKGFSQSCNLVSHKRTHTGQKSCV